MILIVKYFVKIILFFGKMILFFSIGLNRESYETVVFFLQNSNPVIYRTNIIPIKQKSIIGRYLSPK